MDKPSLPANRRPEMSGRHLIDGTYCRFGDEIRSGDLIEGDFDAKDVHTGGGLYLVEQMEKGRLTWAGCRRLMLRPDGIEISDANGHSEVVPDLATVGWRVVGTVMNIYNRRT